MLVRLLEDRGRGRAERRGGWRGGEERRGESGGGQRGAAQGAKDGGQHPPGPPWLTVRLIWPVVLLPWLSLTT